MVAVNTRANTRISLSDTERQGLQESLDAGLSGDGRFVVFSTGAASFTEDDDNTSYDIYIRDTLTGSTTLVSSGLDGSVGSGESVRASVSDDGRFVVFDSLAPDLVSEVTGVNDVFVRDMLTGVTSRVSTSSDGTGGNGPSGVATMSADGRFVVFESDASNLVTGDINGQRDIFRKDLFTDETIRVSTSSIDSGSDDFSSDADVSGDGRFVAFTSVAGNLVSGDFNGFSDVFLKDTLTGETTRVSVSSSEAQATDASFAGSISADGRYVVFESLAADLVTGDGNGLGDVFIRDTSAGTTRIVSVSSTGAAGDGGSGVADVSDDGRFVVFSSSATNLVQNDTNQELDVFLRDMVNGAVIRLSVGFGGVEGNGNSYAAKISGDGRFVVFTTAANNLVAGDTNGETDIIRVSLFATDAADYLIGSDGADTINGLAGADIINAGLGADTLDGGAGGDTLAGGGDNDVYRVDTAADRVVEGVGGGIDNVISTASYGLSAGSEVETLQLSGSTGSIALNLTGNEFSNTLRGNAGNNTLNGGGGTDQLYGLAGNDIYVVDSGFDQVYESAAQGLDTVLTTVSYTLGAAASVEKLTLSSTVGTAALNLTGNAFTNVLQGAAGANVLDGKGGSDSLTGLAGNDAFTFTTALGAANVDTLVDFGTAAGDNDSIRLENAVFTALTTTGALAANAFVANAAGAATTTSHRIVYETDTGRLLYDADGSDAGTAIQFAGLTGAPTLAANDFIVV